jgi:hypothetical protein
MLYLFENKIVYITYLIYILRSMLIDKQIVAVDAITSSIVVGGFIP